MLFAAAGALSGRRRLSSGSHHGRSLPCATISTSAMADASSRAMLAAASMKAWTLLLVGHA
jgi:hypothetical protein